MTGFVFDKEFQERLIAEVRNCMALAVSMQSEINSPDFINHKEDLSPVTKADHAVQARLEAFLKAEMPDCAFLGEETSCKNFKTPSVFWLCDPIDGTREYARGGDDYAVILALIENGHPVFGLIAAPVSGEICYQTESDRVVIRHRDDRIEVIERSSLSGRTRLIVGHGRSHDADAFAERFNVKPEKIISRPSALKFFNLLRDQADYYIRVGQVSEWDIAGGEALLCAAGGVVFHFDGKTRITYGNAKDCFILNGIYASR